MRYLLALAVVVSVIAQAEPKSKPVYRKTQEVNFEETDIDGVVRSPDGAYLLQKRGVKFMPLYKVQKHFDDEIKNSVDYLR
ncbi:MAG: hypothetical protein H6624_10320 [Bdellovibrionaceae bacterium]|nr:hypothetical protein [Bdellovibrionales bacterium]MCB9084729.1 hypothetical protein [Pseudobdellovibrionaceae bacterium]